MLPDREIFAVIKLLAGTPQQIESICSGVDISRLHARSTEEKWSANDILAHLRACADIWGESIESMVAENHPTIRYISPRTWMKKTNYPKLDFYLSFAEFRKQRTDLLELMASLTPESWSRGATIILTKTRREWTVLGYAQRLAGHEDEHCRKLEAMFKI
jgi:hypothetical protein